MQIQILNNFKSPNFDNRQKNSKIKFLVLHYTETISLSEAINILCSPQKKVSCHYIIDTNGDIYNLVDEKKRAWHAGLSCWMNYKNLNSYSVGIEIVNSGEVLKNKYPKNQIKALINLSKQIKSTYKIKTGHILGHSDIAPKRKIDPGIYFPWKILAKYDLGYWVDLKKNISKIDFELKKNELKCFLQNLKIIGYSEVRTSKSFEKNIHVINAFHRHYAPKLIDKFPTHVSYIKSKKLLEMLKKVDT